jgi:hypothetical protein
MKRTNHARRLSATGHEAISQSGYGLPRTGDAHTLPLTHPDPGGLGRVHCGEKTRPDLVSRSGPFFLGRQPSPEPHRYRGLVTPTPHQTRHHGSTSSIPGMQRHAKRTQISVNVIAIRRLRRGQRSTSRLTQEGKNRGSGGSRRERLVVMGYDRHHFRGLDRCRLASSHHWCGHLTGYSGPAPTGHIFTAVRAHVAWVGQCSPTHPRPPLRGHGLGREGTRLRRRPDAYRRGTGWFFSRAFPRAAAFPPRAHV